MDINGENSLSLPFSFLIISTCRVIEWEHVYNLLHQLFPEYRCDSEIVFEFLVVYFLMECIIFLQYDASARYTGLTMLEAKLQTNLLKL